MNTVVAKKLLLVIDQISNPHAGTEGQFLLLIEQLRTAGYQLHVLVLSDSAWLREQGLPCPVDVLGANSIKSPSIWIKMFSFARRKRAEGFGLAHVFFNDASVVCPPMFWLAGIKTIISRRDMGFWYNRIYRFLLPLTGKFVNAVVSNSKAVSDITAQVEKIPPAHLHVIYNGYNRAAPLAHEINELRALKENGAVIFGLVANIRPIKRMQDAIAALALIDPANSNPHLVIVGAGNSAELVALASAQGVAGRVHFLGGRSDVTDCLRYFDAGLLCSESEGFSNAIVEYQFSGLPVICTQTGGNPEAVTHDETGWLYPVGDIELLKAAMDQLLAHPVRAQQMGAAAKRIAESRYSVSAMSQHYQQLYQRIGNW